MKKAIIILSIIFLAVAFGVFVYFVIFGSGTYTTESINNYHDFHSHGENGIKSELLIFPKSISNTKSNTEYYYSFSDTFLDTSLQIYLSCKYTDEEFNNELNRIKSLKYEDESIKLDEKNFNLPAYASRLGYDCTSEYALIDKANNRITYIYLQFAKKEDIHFNKDYLPYNYKTYGECNSSYTLY